MTNEDMTVALANIKAQLATFNDRISKIEKSISGSSNDTSASTDLESIKSKIESIDKTLNSLKIDVQKSMPKKASIEPGTGVKIAYDSDGIIRSSSKLTESDIPTLSIDHIDGLRYELSSFITAAEFNKFKDSLEEKIKPGDTAYTYAKINVDDNGHVTSGGKLIKSDIPKIDISQVENLDIELGAINESISSIRDMIRKINAEPKNTLQSDSSNGLVDIPENVKSEIRELAQSIFLINQRLSRRDSQLYSQVRTMIQGTALNSENSLNQNAVNHDYVSIESVDRILNDIRTSIVELKTQLMNKADSSELTKLENYLNATLSQLPDMQQVIQSANRLTETDSRIIELNDKVMMLSNPPEEKPLTENQKIMRELDNINGMIAYLMNCISGEI